MIKKYFFVILGAVIILPLGIDFFIFGNQYPSNISNEAWAGFLGSYIGGLCTLIALVITIWDNNKKIELQRAEQQIKENERRRLSIRPFMDTRYTYYDQTIDVGVNDRIFEIDNDNVRSVKYSLNQTDRQFISVNCRHEHSKMMFIKYVIRNIGAGSAVEMTATVNGFSEKVAIAQNETIQFLFEVYVKDDNIDLNIELLFGDIESRGIYLKKDCITIFLGDDNEWVSKMTLCGEQKLVK